MIYVDQSREGMRRIRVRWCHMMTDGDIDELHNFAKSIGMQRDWFQEHPLHPHYDLTEGMRKRAVRAGALLVPSRWMVKKCSKLFKKS